MRRASGFLPLMLLLALLRSSSAAQIWAVWDLDLGDHAPPSHFVLTVTSPTGTPVPLPMTVPWARCTAVPGAQHCAPVGCPPTGTYDFHVQAQFAEGLSDPTTTVRCTISTTQCACSAVPPLTQPPATPMPVVSTPPLAQLPPLPPAPRVQGPQVPPGLVLLPLGEIPPTPAVPPIPASAGA